jgi:hypothetical protein
MFFRMTYRNRASRSNKKDEILFPAGDKERKRPSLNVFCKSRLGLPHQAGIRATVDGDVGAVDKGGSLRGEKRDQVGDLFRLAGAA